MGIAIFFLSIMLAIVVWIFLVKYYRAQNKGVLLRHFVGFAVAFFIFIVGTTISSRFLPVSDESQIENTKIKNVEVSKDAITDTAKIDIPQASESATVTNVVELETLEHKPLLNLSLDDYVRQLNTALKNAGSGHKVSKNIKIDLGNVNDTVRFSLNDNVSAVVLLRKNTRELQSVLAVWIPQPDKSDNLTDLIAINAIASAVDSNDSMKIVSGKMVQKISDLMEKWSKNQKESHSDEFIFNNVTYKININSVTGVMISINPTE